MADIYISSTYKDLIKERERAAMAVRRLGHRAIAMEDYVASDERPVDKCLQDVRRCDVYIGIFAWRYGFIPDGYDKSITELEYEAAKDEGIRRLIFLLKEDAPWPVSQVATGDERKKIDSFRAKLVKDHTVSFFSNAHELGEVVSASVGRIKWEAKGKPMLGKLIPKMCNRSDQVASFWRFFIESSGRYPNHPQFYFVHGGKLECHESLLERLKGENLKKYAEDKWGKDYATIVLKHVPWPREAPLPRMKIQLQYDLWSRFGPWEADSGMTANDLVKRPYFSKRPLILIEHNVDASAWNNKTVPLISWYIKEYWAALESLGHEDIPLFLVFFNVKYLLPEKSGLSHALFGSKTRTKKYIRMQLDNFAGSSTPRCPCHVLEELRSIEEEDIWDWFREHHIYEFQSDCREKIETILRVNNKPVKSLCMEQIEKALAEIVRECSSRLEGVI